ncbi:uncharacterized protein ARMOST_14766 [Armillaria ostoyae]|uniref:Uncharacterized protein n=1 Tax=Armillaria ostoyae TaxID=47428 RepID=A0A284RRJ2_ARMOS|nr:uncharacterized protein ARMOST_14766 [Armillaria ostoyae]
MNPGRFEHKNKSSKPKAGRSTSTFPEVPEDDTDGPRNPGTYAYKAGLKSVRLRINRNIKTDGLAGSGRKATLKDVRLRIQSTTETDGQGG